MTPLTTATAPPPQEAVGPLVRGLAVLRELAAADGRRSVGDLVRATGLARSTVDRVVSTLVRTGYLRVEGRDAVLAPRLMELGNAYLAASRFPDLLGPLADALADFLDESVSIAVPDGDGVRFVHQATRRRAMSLTFRIGDQLPAERGAPGALFAGDWDDADWERWRRRRTADPQDTGFPALPRGHGDAAASFAERVAAAGAHGWSADDQLIEPGLIAVAVPVRDGAGRPVCAVSVVSHTSRHSAASLREAVLPRLRETVTAMEDALARPAGAPAPSPAGAPPATWTRASKQELGPEFVESLARGLTVLTAFGEGRGELPLTAVAEATGLARATARRSLITLEHLGYVASEGRLFRLTPHVLELGCAHLSRLTLPEIAQPHLIQLVETVHDSASMAVLSGEDIQYVARVPTVRIMSVNITLGTRFPAYATAMGRVLLAGLPERERAAHLGRTGFTRLTRYTVTDAPHLARVLDEVAADGHALVSEELEEGLRSIAVPVHDRGGRVVAAINVSMHASRRSVEESRSELLPPLLQAAARIGEDLRVAGRYARVPAG
ncbi:IclR family transcriptional regulator C-terminal domain-containing protein [Actinacidiphila glaucinigra]|uniref:IclR family transcriptional regulator domain-containing protein n=1 Tax=Actinacidiphila glaucinigra TaxID=235986 RepID=UPI0033AA55F0